MRYWEYKKHTVTLKRIQQSLKKKALPYTSYTRQQLQPLDTYLGDMNLYPHRNLYMAVHRSFVHNGPILETALTPYSNRDLVK